MILIPPCYQGKKRLVRLNPGQYVHTENPRPSCAYFGAHKAQVIFDGLDMTYAEFLSRSQPLLQGHGEDMEVVLMIHEIPGFIVNGTPTPMPDPANQYIATVLGVACNTLGLKLSTVFESDTQVYNPQVIQADQPDPAGHDGYLPAQQMHFLIGEGQQLEVKPGAFPWVYEPRGWTPQTLWIASGRIKGPWGFSGHLDPTRTYTHEHFTNLVNLKCVAARITYNPALMDTYILMAVSGLRLCLEHYGQEIESRKQFFLEEIGVRFRG